MTSPSWLALSSDGTYYTLPGGRVRIRNHKHFDIEDLVYSSELDKEEARRLVAKDKALFAASGKEDEFWAIEQKICDAYVDIVEMAKEHMDAEQARQLVSHLKKLRYQFVCKFAALADLGDADDGK